MSTTVARVLRQFAMPVCLLMLTTGCGSRAPQFKAGDKGPKVSLGVGKVDPFDMAFELEPTGMMGAGPKKIYTDKKFVISGAEVLGTGLRRDPAGDKSYQVEIFLTEAGNQKLAKLTKENVGDLLVVFVDDELVVAPKINSEAKTAVIASGYTEAEATQLAKKLVGQ